MTTVRSKVVDYYLKLVGKIASGCASLDNCEEYLTCTGVGDRLNDLTRSKPMVQESDYFLEFTKVFVEISVEKDLIDVENKRIIIFLCQLFYSSAV